MRVPLALTALALLGCADPVGPRSDLLRIAAVRSGVALTNVSAEPVYYLVGDTDYLALALVGACDDPVTCPRIEPGERITVPHREITGHEEGGRLATILHWRLVPAGDGGFAPDSVRGLTVELR